MEFRLATAQDLPQLQSVYGAIIEHMNRNQIQIWDEVYPCAFFEADIQNNQLYVLMENTEMVSACVLCDTHTGENAVRWNVNHGNAFYLDRFGVNVKYQRKGIGSIMLTKMCGVAKSKGAVCVRLFVVDCNKPARSLYEKNGFVRADGAYDEVIDDDFTLHEFGYELGWTE